RSTTRLVQVDVIALDKNGRPVRDLRQSDFRLLDEGKAQNLSLFSPEGIKPDAVEAHTPDVPPNVFSNRLRRSESKPGSVTVILFDALNTTPGDQSFVRSQVLEFLNRVQPEDHVAVYLLTSKLTVLNEFTQDTKSLQAAIEKFQTINSLIERN